MHTWTTRVPPARRVPVAYVALGVLYVAAMLGLAGSSALPESFTAAEAARFGFGLFGVFAAVRAARLPHLPRRLRQAWAAVAGCFAVLVVSVPALLVIGTSDTADDVIHMVFVVALLIALQLFPLARTSRRDRLKTAVDALTVLVGGSMVLWYTAFDPLLQSGRLTVDMTVSAVLYPIGDLALLFSVSRALLRGADDTARRPLQLLTAGTLVLFLGDAVNGYLDAHDLMLDSTWPFYWWITTDALLAAAAVEQSRPAVPRAVRSGFRIGRFLPFVAVVVAHALMFEAAVKSGDFSPWGGLALGGAALSALVLYRQTLAQRESDEQALTDPLTGLANRARFRATSHRSLTRGTTAILVIDMNSFKEINDTLGHQAGDLVLVEFAEVLRRCVPSSGLPCRLGGDEFAVVLSDLASPRHAYEVAGRIAAELGPVAVDGKLITLAASIGVAVSAAGELHHDELVHRADLAMYKAKGLGPETRWAVWQEALETAA
ncbi:GGDEF domain-containing protein [Actinoplanes sp. NPDC023714]|uniref:GGDEF domain-containing protein n=1 Tax=Actinoplanes sp. NPDC023714 TaxID=3154322 RepID=UPI0033CC6A60